MAKPEEEARRQIDAALELAGWSVQDVNALNLDAARGVAVREFPLAKGFGTADYLLYVDGRAAGVLEAKKAGTTLTGVECQSEKYAAGVPEDLPAALRPLPFLYQSTGVVTVFTNRLDPEPRSRTIFHFHRPETLADWLEREPTSFPMVGSQQDPLSDRPASFRTRLLTLPQLDAPNLWPAQQMDLEFRRSRIPHQYLHDTESHAYLPGQRQL